MNGEGDISSKSKGSDIMHKTFWSLEGNYFNCLCGWFNCHQKWFGRN